MPRGTIDTTKPVNETKMILEGVERTVRWQVHAMAKPLNGIIIFEMVRFPAGTAKAMNAFRRLQGYSVPGSRVERDCQIREALSKVARSLGIKAY